MRTVPPRMPSHSSSSESTRSVACGLAGDVGAAEQRGERGRVRVALRVRARGDGGVELAPPRGRAATRNATSSSGPHAASATWRGDPRHLSGRGLGVGQVVDEEGAERDVERAVRERQRFGVGADELDRRMPPPRLGEHPLGEIDAGHPRAARGRGRGERAEPAADVEHAHPRPDVAPRRAAARSRPRSRAPSARRRCRRARSSRAPRTP